MANEPQDLTLAESAELKVLSLNPFNNAKRKQRLEELKRKKAAYEEHQKQIALHNQKVMATVMYSIHRDKEVKRLIDDSFSFVQSLLLNHSADLTSLIKNQTTTREDCKLVLEEIVDARLPSGDNFNDFSKRYNRYSAICIAHFLDAAFGFTKDEALKAEFDASSNKFFCALKDLVLQYNLNFMHLNSNDGKDYSGIRDKQCCYNKLVQILNTDKYLNPSTSDTLNDWQEPTSIFVIKTNEEIRKLDNKSNQSADSK